MSYFIKHSKKNVNSSDSEKNVTQIIETKN